MVVKDIRQSAYYRGHDVPDLDAASVLALVSDETSDEDALRALEGMPLLPDYRMQAARRLLLWRGAGGLDEGSAEELRARISDGMDPEEDRRRVVGTLRALMRLAFRACEILDNPGEHALDGAELAGLGLEASPSAQDGALLDYRFVWPVPACSYLQAAWLGCEGLAGAPFWCECTVLPEDPADDWNPVLGWAGNTHGATLCFSQRGVADGRAGREEAVRTLLKFLLDLGLSDCRVVTYDGGKELVAAPHAVAAAWSTLREQMDVGRAGVCRVCGRPFVAIGERKSKARYCQPNGACSKAFRRTRGVLRAVAEGAELEYAVAHTAGISLARFADIALRNRASLETEYGAAVMAKVCEQIEDGAGAPGGEA